MIPTIKVSREEAVARGCPAVGSHVEVAVEAWDAFDKKFPLRKRMVLEQAGATEREAVRAWTMAFRAESAVLGGIQTTTVQAGRLWVAMARVSVTEAQYQRIQHKRESLGAPRAQEWEEI